MTHKRQSIAAYVARYGLQLHIFERVGKQPEWFIAKHGQRISPMLTLQGVLDWMAGWRMCKYMLLHEDQTPDIYDMLRGDPDL